jgi:AraC-like DNA-binding protein
LKPTLGEARVERSREHSRSRPEAVESVRPGARDDARAWTGRALLRRQRLLYVGPVQRTELHAHHAFQVMVAPTTFVLRDAAGGRVASRAAVVPADVAHAIEQGVTPAALLFVAPEHRDGRALAALGVARDAPSWARAARALEGHVLPMDGPPQRYEALAAALLASLSEPAPLPVEALHPAVTRALALIDAHVEEQSIRLAALATAAGISSSRLSHLFREQLGVPLRPYVRWLRIERAAVSLGRGANLTEAAHAAGFTDSAHLTHAFRRAFGITPSDFSRRVEWLSVPRATHA